MLPSRRSFLRAGVSTAVAAPLLAACGSSTSSSGSSSSSSTGAAAGGAEPGALPVSIEHKFGTTRITTVPKRVVCVGLVEQDALLALGVVPVGVTKFYGKAAGAIFPWATGALGSADLPTVLDSTNGVPVEKVAALRPDLIIGQYSGITKKEYALLSKIAPTVAQSGDYVDYGMPWEESTENIGKAVGQPKAAAALVEKVNGQIDAAAREHPEFKGKNAVVVTPYQGLYVYGPEDLRARMLSRLGFVFPAALESVVNKGEFGGSVSAERTDELGVDAVVWLSTPAKVAKATGGLWAKTTASQEGRAVFIADDENDYSVAQSMVTPLSIPYVLERYVPQLAAAVDGKTSTEVESISS